MSRADQLPRLRRLDRAVRRIALDLPGLSPSENAAYEQRLNRDHNECGCHMGATASLLGTASCILGLAIAGVPAFRWSTVAIVAAAFLGSAGVGKLIGLGRARLRYRRTLLELGQKL